MGLRKPKKAEEIKLPDLSNAASAGHVLANRQVLNGDGEVMVGTMPDNGAKTAALNAGGSFTIPAGYHNGNGKVTANSLASQTSATATTADIAAGLTAWVNGAKVTGTLGKVEYGTFVGKNSNTINVPGLKGKTNFCIACTVADSQYIFGQITTEIFKAGFLGRVSVANTDVLTLDSVTGDISYGRDGGYGFVDGGTYNYVAW